MSKAFSAHLRVWRHQRTAPNKEHNHALSLWFIYTWNQSEYWLLWTGSKRTRNRLNRAGWKSARKSTRYTTKCRNVEWDTMASLLFFFFFWRRLGKGKWCFLICNWSAVKLDCMSSGFTLLLAHNFRCFVVEILCAESYANPFLNSRWVEISNVLSISFWILSFHTHNTLLLIVRRSFPIIFGLVSFRCRQFI